MSRRANHEGSIRQREDSVWEAAISIDGRRYYVRGRTRTEAQRKLSDLRHQHAAGELVPPSRMTVAEFLTTWLEANRGAWRPSTYAGYEGIVRNYLVPAYGKRRLQALTAADIARQYGRWRDAAVGARTLAIIHARTHRALQQAMYWGLIPRNPADAVEPPRSTYRRPDLWEPATVARFVATLEGDTWDSALAAVLIGAGLRLGEAFALRWDDVDLADARLTVTMGRTRIGATWVDGAPKTAAGLRTVALPSFVVSALRRWRRVQAEAQLATGPAWEGAGRVITLPDGRTPGRRQAGERLAQRAKRLGLPPLRNHDLRHLSASLALSAGIPLTDVSRRLGHANVAITASTYAHALRKDDAHIAAALDLAVGAG